MKMTTICCDTCAKDLGETSNSIAYRLALITEKIPCRDGIVTDMMVYPPISRNAHFCGVNCLVSWVKKNYMPEIKKKKDKCSDYRGNILCSNGVDTYHEWNERESGGCHYCR